MVTSAVPAKSAPSHTSPCSAMLDGMRMKLQALRRRLAADEYSDEEGLMVRADLPEFILECRDVLTLAGLLPQLAGYLKKADQERIDHRDLLRRGQSRRAWKALVAACDTIGECLADTARLIARNDGQPIPSPLGEAAGLVALLPQLAELRAELAAGQQKPNQAARAAALLRDFRRAVLMDGLLSRADGFLIKAKADLTRQPLLQADLVTICEGLWEWPNTSAPSSRRNNHATARLGARAA